MQVEKWVDPKNGQSTGRIKHPDSLLRAVQTLVSRSGVNAIAVVGRFPDDIDAEGTDDYRQGMVWQEQFIPYQMFTKGMPLVLYGHMAELSKLLSTLHYSHLCINCSRVSFSKDNSVIL